MSNLIVVIGATGGQGGGVVNAFLNEAGWKVRGTTRNTSSEKAKALSAKGVEVVSANLNDEESLEKAFQGATAIFAFTDYYETFFELGDEKSLELEFAQGQKIARAAAKNQSLQRLVFSAGPHTSMITNGEAICPHLEGKGRIVTYVTQEMPDLAAKTTFAVFTVFANNALLYDIFKPIYVWEGITIVEGMDLLTDEDKKELLSVEESLKRYDWSAFEKKPTAKAVTGRFST
ncbi:hypothetical protein COL154_010453 [Colletotrichum chrysophilum]|nr:hypothetical protein KNSL1_011701 [Colletotrichum chrysophilum]KAJ0357080.1 hypothetical protein COL154_010453 [Colletotrichum chrysophilum]